MTGGDSVDVTIRVANSGGAVFGSGVLVSVYADTIVRDSSVVDGPMARLPDSLILAGETTSGPLEADRYEDVMFTITLPMETKRLWFVVDGVNRYFECNEKDNVLTLGLE